MGLRLAQKRLNGQRHLFFFFNLLIKLNRLSYFFLFKQLTPVNEATSKAKLRDTAIAALKTEHLIVALRKNA